MSRLELTGNIDERHLLSVSVPDDIRPGPVRVILEVPSDEEKDDWAAAVARIWAADWSDPREDIYTMEDGVPADGAR